MPAPDAIADALGVPPGAQVIRRHRVTYRDDAPVSASTSWLPGDLAGLAPRLLTTERILEGTPGYIEHEPAAPSCAASTRSPPGPRLSRMRRTLGFRPAPP